MYTAEQTEIESNEPSSAFHNYHEPARRVKEQRRNFRKKVFGDHYNYNYRKPNQHKMYRIQENRNTEIERENRILLEKIQGIFKRSMGKKRAAMLQSADKEETHNFVQENIIRTKGRMSTESVHQKSQVKNKEHHQSLQRGKRVNTQMVLDKMQKIRPEDSRVTNKQKQERQIQEMPTKRKALGRRVNLFKGKEYINNTPFKFQIFVEGETYSIIAEQENAEIQEQINIPYQDYKKLNKKYLNNDHASILDYLHINLDTGLLELVGFEASMMDIVQYGEVQVEPIVRPIPEILTNHQRSVRRKTESEKYEKKEFEIEQKIEALQEDHEGKKIKKGELKNCNYSGNVINLHISPRDNNRGKGGEKEERGEREQREQREERIERGEKEEKEEREQREQSEGKEKEPDKGQSSHENTSIFPQFDQENREEI